MINKEIVIILSILLISLSAIQSTAINTANKPNILSSSNNVLYVGGVGPNNYTRIQDAINDASNGYTVFVYDDSSPYYEEIVINKSIKLIGEDKNTTIINFLYIGTVIHVSADRVKISGFTIEGGNSYGIHVNSNHNIITDNIIKWIEYYGIALKDSTNTIIINNYIEEGIYISGSSIKTTIMGNKIQGGRDGILLFSDNNTIIGNNISRNYFHGIVAYSSNGNTNNHIYHNNFIDNKRNAYDGGKGNYWDDGYPSGGNYWDDYTGSDDNGDGIGDSPYIPGAGNIKDRYPLMEPHKRNIPPIPPIITGPISGRVGMTYNYKFLSIDPEGDDIWFYIKWDDYSNRKWDGPYPSGTEITRSYRWSKRGTYSIKAKAMDEYSDESEWSEFEVKITIPRNRSILWLRFIDMFPILQRIINYIL